MIRKHWLHSVSGFRELFRFGKYQNTHPCLTPGGIDKCCRRYTRSKQGHDTPTARRLVPPEGGRRKTSPPSGGPNLKLASRLAAVLSCEGFGPVRDIRETAV